ncbi:MAG TPA: phosphomannomutase/phosphoglucomutase [Candidatus Saccharimonadales bacterium]|nr:phosphomannomutase/phosphoglucomutase [Candidatus Saccharimonadales bacterium]
MDAINTIFKAYDVRGKVGTELTADTVKAIGKAFAAWLPADGPVVIGHDMRTDSADLARALADGIRSQGRDVWDIGLASSDMVYFAPGKFEELAGGAVITASHNPGEYNGIKFCREKALPVGIESGLAEIRDMVVAGKPSQAAAKEGAVIKKDLLETWIDHVLTFVDVSKIKPLRIGVDAGNGMCGLTMPKLAQRLPITVEPLYFELDGTFPNHEANPMKTETLHDLSKLIVAKKLDFGIAFDGDGDRMALVDEHGEPLTGSMTFALLSQYVLARHPGATVVHDLRMSRSTLDMIHKAGGKTVNAKVGNTFIKELVRQHDADLGGEITGHFMFKENYFVDSGLLAALIAIEVLSEADFTLSEFVKRYDTYAHRPEINLHVEDKRAALEKLAGAFDDAELSHLDGLSVDYPDRWFNLRPSNTEPMMRLNGEAKTLEDFDAMTAKVSKIVEGM